MSYGAARSRSYELPVPLRNSCESGSNPVLIAGQTLHHRATKYPREGKEGEDDKKKTKKIKRRKHRRQKRIKRKELYKNIVKP